MDKSVAHNIHLNSINGTAAQTSLQGCKDHPPSSTIHASVHVHVIDSTKISFAEKEQVGSKSSVQHF
jgi:hypothetical protein